MQLFRACVLCGACATHSTACTSRIAYHVCIAVSRLINRAQKPAWLTPGLWYGRIYIAASEGVPQVYSARATSGITSRERTGCCYAIYTIYYIYNIYCIVVDWCVFAVGCRARALLPARECFPRAICDATWKIARRIPPGYNVKMMQIIGLNGYAIIICRACGACDVCGFTRPRSYMRCVYSRTYWGILEFGTCVLGGFPHGNLM